MAGRCADFTGGRYDLRSAGAVWWPARVSPDGPGIVLVRAVSQSVSDVSCDLAVDPQRCEAVSVERKMFEHSGDLLPPSPPAEKATAR